MDALVHSPKPNKPWNKDARSRKAPSLLFASFAPFRGFRVPVLCALFLLLPLSACKWQPERYVEVIRYQTLSPAARLVYLGDRALAEGRTAEAILAYRNAAETDPHHVPALLRLGRAYANQGRRRLALRYLQAAQTFQPHDVEIAADLAAVQAAWLPADPPLRLLWQAHIGKGMPVGMAAEGETIYVTSEGGVLAALSAQSGQVRYQTVLSTALTSVPGVGGGVVLVGGEDGVLHALAAADGQPRWTFAARGQIYAQPVISGETVFCASEDGYLYALALTDGSLRWKFNAGGMILAAPALADGVVYFGAATARVHALDAATGVPRWQSGFLTLGMIQCTPTIANGRVYVGSGDSRLYSLAVESGGQYWFYSTSDAIYARPLVIGGTVYLASSGQTLSAVDAVTGQARWELRARSPLIFPPLPVGETLLFAASADPTLYAVRRATGESLWQLDTGDWLAAPPLQIGPMLYLLGKDGTLLAYAL